MRAVDSGFPLTIPVVPDAPEARRWVQEELAQPAYAASRPTWFDRLSQSFFDWLASLTAPAGDGWNAWIPVILAVLVAAAVLAAWFIFGVPRRNRRMQAASTLFGALDRRRAAEMRTAAESAALAENWGLASEEIFRALAADLAERTVVTVTPGTTAHAFATRAASAFPREQDRLADAAGVFDRVRYLGAAGAEADYRRIAALEKGLRGLMPTQVESVGSPMPS